MIEAVLIIIYIAGAFYGLRKYTCLCGEHGFSDFCAVFLWFLYIPYYHLKERGGKNA